MTGLRHDDATVVPLRPTREQLRRLQEENAQLRSALESRIIVEQAKGALSARLGTTPDVAFAMMCGLARSQRRSLQDYAAEVVERGGRL
jgi:AmiR/NasT family two-component response regulator